MNIYLHIGWHKTGTTAIQNLLVHNRDELRRQCSMIYPKAGIYNVAHSLPAWGLQSPARDRLLKRIGCARAPEALFRDMADEAAAAGAGSVVLSAEEFSPIHLYSLERLKRCLEGHRVVVIAYVRRQDQYLESVYNQSVKFHRSRYMGGVQPYVDRYLKTNQLDYDLYFRKWADVFGKENLRVRVYERDRFPERDVRRDFCSLIGLDAARLAWQGGDTNVSLDADSVYFLQRFNRVPLTEEQHKVVVNLLAEFERGAAERPRPLLEPAQRMCIVEQYRESNRRFACEFLGCEDPFGPVDATELTPPRPLSEQRFMEILGFVLPRLMDAGEVQPGTPSPPGRGSPPQSSRGL
jgi:hypothetical protein